MPLLPSHSTHLLPSKASFPPTYHRGITGGARRGGPTRGCEPSIPVRGGGNGGAGDGTETQLLLSSGPLLASEESEVEDEAAGERASTASMAGLLRELGSGSGTARVGASYRTGGPPLLLPLLLGLRGR